jgi:hypothetical protein
MDKVTTLAIPAGLAYLGVKGAELAGQKGAVGALLGILGAAIGLAISNRIAGVAGVKKAVAPAASV